MGGAVRDELPVVPAERRAQILDLPLDPRRAAATHAELLGEFSFLDDVEMRPPGSVRPAPGPELRIACWNMERGRYLERSAQLLSAAGADAYLLTELDLGMARTGQRHIARELAASLGCGYAYGVEFLELGLGNERERDEHRGSSNQAGFHGGAILSPHVLERPELVRLDRSGFWFDGSNGERRVGGRMAVLSTLKAGGVDVTLASVHLESHGDPAGRAAQFGALLDAVEAYRPGAPALIGGDVNTTSFGREEVRDREQLKRLLGADPQRLLNPVAYEPLFSAAEERGYDWRSCNQLEVSTQRTYKPNARGGMRLDWFFSRGLRAQNPEVIAAVAPDLEVPLSDHEMIAVTLELG